MPHITKHRIDLYLGSDLGLWVLDQITTNHVHLVITADDQIAARATEQGFAVVYGNANNKDFHAASTAFSIHYPFILRSHILCRYNAAYNLHPGFLPWGRGYYPVFWAMWEQTPAGATLHAMNERVDQGAIIAQTQVAYTLSDTGATLFSRVRDAERKLFQTYWPQICQEATLQSRPQTPGAGSYHSQREFFALKQNPPLETMDAQALLRLVRCLSFPGHTGLEISYGAEVYHLRLEPLA